MIPQHQNALVGRDYIPEAIEREHSEASSHLFNTMQALWVAHSERRQGHEIQQFTTILAGTASACNAMLCELAIGLKVPKPSPEKEEALIVALMKPMQDELSRILAASAAAKKAAGSN